MADPTRLFQQTVTYALITGRDTYGKQTLGPQSTARARVEPTSKVIRDVAQVEHVAAHVVYTAAAITLDHRVWLPGSNTADATAAKRPIQVREHVDGAGAASHREVWFA